MSVCGQKWPYVGQKMTLCGQHMDPITLLILFVCLDL